MKKTFLYHEKIIYHNRIVTYGFVGFGTGMPSGWQGVMLQGFYWDSFSDTQ